MHVNFCIVNLTQGQVELFIENPTNIEDQLVINPISVHLEDISWEIAQWYKSIDCSPKKHGFN